MSLICRRFHGLVSALPEIHWPLDVAQLPRNGIYFFYETGEAWGHGGNHARIVRVGTHREGNFRLRMADHYIFNNRKMDFDQTKPAPKDRSIFRKNIGRALLNRDRDPYLSLWNTEFTTRASRNQFGSQRNVQKEKQIESEVTHLLRERFTFRWIALDGEERRMGSHGLEAAFIGTLARCDECRPSDNWLGRHSPKPKIVESGLWLEQHLQAAELTDAAMSEVARLVGQ